MWFPYLVIGYTSGIFRDVEIKKINYLKSICFGIMLIGIVMLMYDANAYSYEIANNGANVAAFKSVGLFLIVTAICILYNIKLEHVKLRSIICDFLSIFSSILYFSQRIVIDFIMYRWNYINAGDFTWLKCYILVIVSILLISIIYTIFKHEIISKEIIYHRPR